MSSVSRADDRKTYLDGLAIGLIIVCCMIWGVQQIFIKAIASEVPLIMQATIRSFGASICVFLWMLFKKIPVIKSDKTLLPGAIAGFLFALEFAALYAGLEYTNTSRAIIFLYVAPFIVVSLLPIFIKTERLNLIQVVGLIVAFLAVAFMFQEGLTTYQDSYLKGDLLILVAAVAWGVTTVSVRISTLAYIDPARTIFYQLFFSGIFLSIYCLFAGIALPASISMLAITSLFFQTVIVAAISYLIWFWLLRNYLVSKVSSFGFLTPIFGLIFSIIFMGDPLTIRVLIALGGVAVGIFLVNRKV